MESWNVIAWLASAAVAAVVGHHARKAGRPKWAVWGLGTLFFPWVVAPIYAVVTLGKVSTATAAAGGRTRGAITRANGELREADLQKVATDLAEGDGAARARIIRELGGAWADAMADSAHPKNVALIRINVGKAADAAKLDDIGRAAEHLMKAMSQVPPDRKGHPGGRILLGGVNRAVEIVAAEKRKAGQRPAPRQEEAPDPVERLMTTPEPKVITVERPAQPFRESAPAGDVPGFLAAREAPKAEAQEAEAPALKTETLTLKTETLTLKTEARSPKAEVPAPSPPPPPGVLPPVAAARFAGADLADLSSDVTELARQWLGAIAEAATPVDRSTARVRLESAASAVFRGDWARAIEMAEAAATLVPADGEAALILRAGLAHARAARAVVAA